MLTPARIASSTLIAAALAACPGGGDTPDAADGVVDFDCQNRLIVELRGPGGEYRTFPDAASGAELVLGFQGFRYMYLRARLGEDPDLAAAAVVVQLDGDTARSQPLYLTFAPVADGVVSAPMQIFFNDDPLPSLVDRGVTVMLVLGLRCTTGGHSVLRYDPSCYEGPDGQPVCDGGP